MEGNLTEGEDENFPYRELIGSVMFLMVCTRPDIAYTVSALSQFLDKPTPGHWSAAKRLLRYLNGTRNLGIRYFGSSPLTGFSDSDHAGDVESRRSRSGVICMMNNGPVLWLSQKQSLVCTSTCQAELAAAFAAY